MSRRLYFESSAADKPQFVSIGRSRSYVQPRHQYVEHDYRRVSVTEWNLVKERERCLEKTNQSLVSEVRSLKVDLSDSQREAHQLRHIVVPQLKRQCQVLTVDNEAFRQTLDDAGRKEAKRHQEKDKMRRKIESLEDKKNGLQKENSNLKDEMKQLRRKFKLESEQPTCEPPEEISYWRDQCRYWRRNCDDIKRSLREVRSALDIRTKKMRVYEDILKRQGFI